VNGNLFEYGDPHLVMPSGNVAFKRGYSSLHSQCSV
jgi:hypothetical protein